MALFMLMSGMLFYKKAIECVHNAQRNKEIIKRARRLIVPYLFYSIMILVVKSVTSLGRKPIGMWTIIGILFGDSPCGNMWFLWTLFILSSIVLFIPHKSRKPEWIVVIAAALYLLQNSVEWFDRFGINKILNMLLWFSLGICMCKYVLLVGRKQKKSDFLMGCTLATASFALQTFLLCFGKEITNVHIGLLIKAVLALSDIIFIWSLSYLFTWTKKSNVISTTLSYLGKNSIAIYALSYFVQTPCVTVYCKIGNLGIPYSVWVVGSTLGALAFSIAAASVIRKSRLLKRLMLGE